MIKAPILSNKLVAGSLRLLFLFNLLDAFLTVLWVQSGVAVEANPIMSAAMSYGMSFFVLIKISMVVCAIAILWHTRRHTLSRWASLLTSVLMGSLVVYHAIGIFSAVYL